MNKVIRYMVLILLLVGLFSSCRSSVEAKRTETGPKPVALKPCGKLSFPPIEESSGIVKSRKWDNVFWTHNDSGNGPYIFPVRKDGSIVKPAGVGKGYAGVEVLGAKNVDWEDITMDDKGNLIIGDFGDNFNIRRNLTLYVLPEPNPFKDVNAQVKQEILFHYPDQKGIFPMNFDAEAAFSAKGKTYILTKHRSDNSTKLYRLDSANPEKDNPLTLLDEFNIRGKVTGADAEGNRLAVLTYNAVWLFEAPDASDDYFKGKAWWLPIKGGQCEAICFDGDRLILSNEKRKLFELPIDRLIRIKE